MVEQQYFLQLFPIQRPSLPPPLSLLPPLKARSQFITSLHQNGSPSQLSLRSSTTSRSSSSSSSSSSGRIRAALSDEEFPPNAVRWKRNSDWLGGFSLGLDLGMSRTGVALGKSFITRPLTVLELRGEKLELRLLEIAERQEVDEFIIGIPKSGDGKENQQSNKVRSVAGRFAVRAAERGWRVYLQNEHGTSTEAQDFMLNMGLKKSARQGKIDAYAAMMVLERYFSMSGVGTELVLPKQLELQEKLRQGPPKDLDFFPE